MKTEDAIREEYEQAINSWATTFARRDNGLREAAFWRAGELANVLEIDATTHRQNLDAARQRLYDDPERKAAIKAGNLDMLMVGDPIRLTRDLKFADGSAGDRDTVEMFVTEVDRERRTVTGADADGSISFEMEYRA